MESKRKLKKVLPQLRKRERNNENNYNPVAVSIGPYHHENKQELWLGQDLKNKFVEEYLTGSHTDRSSLYKEVLENVHFFRSFYEESGDKHYNNEEFAEMMLVDGCFVLQFLVRDSYDDLFPEMAKDEVYQDIFLLENQVPYPVLQLLMRYKYNERQWERFLNKVRHWTFWKETPDWKLVGLDNLTNVKQQWDYSEGSSQPLHLLDIVSRYYDIKVHQEQPSTGAVLSLPSIMELKAKGIHFKPSLTTDTNKFRYVKFSSFCFRGWLEIPACGIGILTKPTLLNVIAYEMSINNSSNLTLTSYISFMRSLIDNVEDVRELKSRGILNNFLGSDEDVVKMFQEIDVAPYCFAKFEGVVQSIHKHINSKRKTWLSELHSKYFTSPWTTIAILASTVVIFLTFVQTYYTIYPR